MKNTNNTPAQIKAKIFKGQQFAEVTDEVLDLMDQMIEANEPTESNFVELTDENFEELFGTDEEEIDPETNCPVFVGDYTGMVNAEKGKIFQTSSFVNGGLGKVDYPEDEYETMLFVNTAHNTITANITGLSYGSSWEYSIHISDELYTVNFNKTGIRTKAHAINYAKKVLNNKI